MAASLDVGIGMRQPHCDMLLRERPALGLIESHSENFFADGGALRSPMNSSLRRCAALAGDA